MNILANLQKPSNCHIIKQIETNDLCYAKLELSPLERGFGHTLGNALRRVILSSIPGCSVVGVLIDGVEHEFDSIKGIQEDVLNIILNLKQLALSIGDNKKNEILELNVKGPKIVTVADINGKQNVTLHNKEHIIANLNEGAELNMQIYISQGLGYVISEDHDYTVFGDNIPSNLLKVDSVFSPVQNMGYYVESSRVKQKTDYDKLIIELETNKTVDSLDIVKIAATILQDQLSVFALDFSEGLEIEQKEESEYDRLLKKSVVDLDLKVRSLNCLRAEGVFTINDLIQKSEKDLLKAPNLGRKSLTEIRDSLSKLGLSLKKD